MLLPPPMHLSHIHVRDVAQAIIRLLRDPPMHRKPGIYAPPKAFAGQICLQW